MFDEMKICEDFVFDENTRIFKGFVDNARKVLIADSQL